MVMTVPLHGKKAAGRVALVDDEDYDLVMAYRWHVREKPAKGNRQRKGPYAGTYARGGGRRRSIFMHALIMGAPGVDHVNHNGLDNRRRNLRPATGSQNNQNQRPQAGRTSQYKGVWLSANTGLWHADIKLNGRKRTLGQFVSELEAAYAYDAAARKLFGEFAYPNFPGEPTAVMRDQWRAETEARRAIVAVAARSAQAAGVSAWWAQRETRMGVCVICGSEYQYRSIRESSYCGNTCRCRAKKLRKIARERDERLDGRLF